MHQKQPPAKYARFIDTSCQCTTRHDGCVRRFAWRKGVWKHYSIHGGFCPVFPGKAKFSDKKVMSEEKTEENRRIASMEYL
jgi:hypothetical protein